MVIVWLCRGTAGAFAGAAGTACTVFAAGVGRWYQRRPPPTLDGSHPEYGDRDLVL